jgi:heme-degrading monooxygenase HmoA
MDRSVYVSVSRLRVEPERVEALVAAFRARANLVDAFPGFLGLEVWRSERTPDEVLMVSHWRSRAEFTAYMKSPAHQVSHDRIPVDLQAAIRLERLEHQTGYEVVAR